MPKGPSFRDENGRRHTQRLNGIPWWEQCSYVDPEALRVSLSIEAVRERGGLSYEEKQALRQKIASIQRDKEMRTRKIEGRQTADENRRQKEAMFQFNRAQAIGLQRLLLEQATPDMQCELLTQGNMSEIYVRVGYRRFILPTLGSYTESEPDSPKPTMEEPISIPETAESLIHRGLDG